MRQGESEVPQCVCEHRLGKRRSLGDVCIDLWVGHRLPHDSRVQRWKRLAQAACFCRLDYFVSSATTRESESRPSGMRQPKTRASFEQSSIELSGRLAGVGYSEVGMGSTEASFVPGSCFCSSAMACAANPYHVVSPEPVAWYTPLRGRTASLKEHA